MKQAKIITKTDKQKERIILLNRGDEKPAKKPLKNAKALDPYGLPTCLVNASASPRRNGPSMTIQLSETKEERTLINHKKHLKNWDRYE